MATRKIKYVRLHDLNVVVDGIGNITKELPMQNKTLNGLEMFTGLDEGFITVNITGGRQFGIPLANVQFVVFDKETAATSTVSNIKAIN